MTQLYLHHNKKNPVYSWIEGTNEAHYLTHLQPITETNWGQDKPMTQPNLPQK